MGGGIGAASISSGQKCAWYEGQGVISQVKGNFTEILRNTSCVKQKMMSSLLCLSDPPLNLIVIKDNRLFRITLNGKARVSKPYINPTNRNWLLELLISPICISHNRTVGPPNLFSDLLSPNTFSFGVKKLCAYVELILHVSISRI